MKEHYPFILKELPYNYDALEPYIDEETVRIHYNKHLKTYVDKLNETLETYTMYHNFSLETLLCNLDKLPRKIRESVRNNGGGVFNHNIYFSILERKGSKKPIGNIEKAIQKEFNTYEQLVEKLRNEANNLFGSGYAWLAMDNNKRLKVVTTRNQDTVLAINLYPILLIDVWEHAYYLKYQNRRARYTDNFFNIINWEKVEENYNNGVKYFNRVLNIPN